MLTLSLSDTVLRGHLALRIKRSDDGDCVARIVGWRATTAENVHHFQGIAFDGQTFHVA